MGKILKNSNNLNIESLPMDTFRKVEKGTKEFDVETFSTVDKGTKEFVMQTFDTISAEAVEEKPSVEPAPAEEPVVSEEPEEIVPENMITLEQHEALLKSAVEEATTNASKEGYQNGFAEAKKQYEKSYMAEKQDYLGQLESKMTAAVNELTQIKQMLNDVDKDLPAIVLGFVKEIIGVERKLNDELIVSTIRNGLNRLKDMEDITFLINPEDEHTVKTHVNGYPLEIDPTVEVGGFTVRTRIGEMDFRIETLINNLENAINEKLATSENS